MLWPVQVGLDDVLHSWYRDQQVQQTRAIIASCSAAGCRAAARTGVPASERPWVWPTALGLAACPPGPDSRPAGSKAPQALHLPAAAGAEHNMWWHLPNAWHEERLRLLCTAVKKQVRGQQLLLLAACAGLAAVQPPVQDRVDAQPELSATRLYPGQVCRT